MIYLATAYSHPDPEVRRERFYLACRVAGEMMAQGDFVYSPICHTHPIAEMCDLPTDWDYWKRFDEQMIAKCDRLVVVQSDGWLESKGIAAEIEIANRQGIPVEWMAV